jgi:hypothetical protein
MMKKIVTLALAVLMLMAFATTALAYSYDFSFEPPFAGCMESTSLKTVTGNPYVDPDGSAAATRYFLSPVRHSSTQATDVIVKSNGTKSYFTYESGYSGSGTSLCLSGCPKATDFNAYTIGGTWMP